MTTIGHKTTPMDNLCTTVLQLVLLPLERMSIYARFVFIFILPTDLLVFDVGSFSGQQRLCQYKPIVFNHSRHVLYLHP